MARTLIIIAALLGLVTGWYARGRLSPVVQAVQQADPLIGILRKALQKADARDVAITDSARQAIAAFAAYRKRIDSLRVREARVDTVFREAARDSTVSKDSTVLLCSIVILTCQERADLAEREAELLKDRIQSLLLLQPRRVSIGLFGGPSYCPYRWGQFGACVGMGVNIRLR